MTSKTLNRFAYTSLYEKKRINASYALVRVHEVFLLFITKDQPYKFIELIRKNRTDFNLLVVFFFSQTNVN